MNEMRRTYSAKFKARMVQRMTSPNPETGAAVAKATGVSKSSLSKWRLEATTMARMKKKTEPKAEGVAKRPIDWTAEQKLVIVAKAMTMEDEQLGELLRTEGLHDAQLKEWKAAFLSAIKPSSDRSTTRERKRIRKLERELNRKEKALAETAALLVLQGKVRALWEEEGDDI